MAEPMSRRKETSSILKEYSRTPPPEKTRLSRELNTDTGLAQARLVTEHALQKGGVPAAPSGTATLLRLKARERIHRAMADARLLANPASWSRVADSSPN